jgi:cardiolipin synthase A/B
MTSSTPEPPHSLTSERGPGRWRRRLRRALRALAALFLIALVAGWWFVLRIVEDDHWPPPADAVTAAGSQAMTEAFARRDDPWRDDVAIPYAPSTASSVRLYPGGEQFFPAMLAEIEDARRSIHLMMFTFTPGEWGTRFADTLSAKAREGVEVRLTVDRYGAKVNGKSAAMFGAMADAGVQIVVNDIFPLQAEGVLPDRARTLRQDEVGQADHRKLLIVDGRSGWIGGAGFEDHFAAGPTGGFHDVFVRVEGDIVRQMQAVFLTSFRAYGGAVPQDLAPYFPEPDDPGAIHVTLLQNIPGGFLPATQASREVLEGARETLDIMNPYFTDTGMLDRIVDAGERGVRVRILVPVESNNPPADAALRHQYGRLRDVGVEIWEYPAVMHAKVTVADDTVIVGTVNYDAWALYRNLEIALLIENAAVADDARASFIEPDIARSRPGEGLSGRRESIEGWIWDKLTYFL